VACDNAPPHPRRTRAAPRALRERLAQASGLV